MISKRLVFSLTCLLSSAFLLLSGGQLSAYYFNKVIEANKQVAQPAHVITVTGVVGPVMQEYIEQALEEAHRERAAILVIRMDTPGGLDSSTRKIIQGILSSSIPVALYVAPPGARAASAGTYILSAAHIAAMAPATNLGAATPVMMDVSSHTDHAEASKDKEEEEDKEPLSKEKEEKDKEELSQEEEEKDQFREDASPMERKIVNDSAAYIRSLANLRGRNAEWAEKAVRDAVSLPADEALEKNVIDLVAQNVPDLLRAIDGRVVDVNGQDFTLKTAGISFKEKEYTWRTRLLSIMTDPSIAYLLFTLGIYGLIFEAIYPGAMIPGILGAIFVISGLYAFQALPVNYAGVLLMCLGVLFMCLEFLVAGFGALALGGILAFAYGSLILFDPSAADALAGTDALALPLPVIFTVLGIMATITLGVMYLFVSSHRAKLSSGDEAIVGLIGEVLDPKAGTVRVQGEVWKVQSKTPLQKGRKVRVLKVDGLILNVESLKESS